MNPSHDSRYVLCFRPLSEQASGFAFPCNERGEVDLDLLSDSARNDYLFARAMVGRELREPAVVVRTVH